MCFSSNLLTMGRREIGLQFQGLDESPDLGTGTMREDFQLSGQVAIPVESDMLKIAVIIGVIEDTVSFSMRADILSRPIALLMSSEQIRWQVFSSYQQVHVLVPGYALIRSRHFQRTLSGPERASNTTTVIRELVDSLCRDSADAQYMQYLSKAAV